MNQTTQHFDIKSVETLQIITWTQLQNAQEKFNQILSIVVKELSDIWREYYPSIVVTISNIVVTITDFLQKLPKEYWINIIIAICELFSR
jgi:hypothetical protein